MRKDEAIAFLVIMFVTLISAFVFFAVAIDSDSHESDPAVYERYVEDMRQIGLKPDGNPIEPDAFQDSIWWMERKE